MLDHQLGFHRVECNVDSFDLLTECILFELLGVDLIMVVQLRFLLVHLLLMFVGLDALLHFLDALGQALLAQLFVLFFCLQDSTISQANLLCLLLYHFRERLLDIPHQLKSLHWLISHGEGDHGDLGGNRWSLRVGRSQSIEVLLKA